MVRPALLALAVAAALGPAGCGRRAPDVPGVRLYVSSDLPGEVVADAAGHFGVARVALVARPDDAEVAWLSDPTDALALGARLAAGTAPPQPDVEARWKDPRGRFAPLGARARVLVLDPRASLPFSPRNLRDLVDPRVAGRQVLVPLGRGAGPVTIAALALTYGDASAARFLHLLARGRPQLVDTDAQVRARVAARAAAVGLAGSIDGAAGAASAAALEVVYPDQGGRGAVVLPTAVALLAGAGEGGGRLAAWLAGARAEEVVVARTPGLLPLRPGVPVPVGVEPAGNLASLPLDWDRLLDEERRLAPSLERWPEGFGSGK
jgi:iron(III) transport system substrate-binding protein